MRSRLFAGVVLLLALPCLVHAQAEPRAIIEKAVKAMGGKEKLAKLKGMVLKTKGTLEQPMTLSFTQEMMAQAPKFKETVQLSVMGTDVTIISVFDGEKAYIKVKAGGNDMDIPLDDKLQEELKEASYALKLGRMLFLDDDKSLELSALGETTVNNKPAVGVKIASKGHKDINFYFDKETGLVSKVERRALDSTTMQEVTEERIIQEYGETDGLKTAKKVLVNRDGKKYLEAEVLESKFVDKIDDSEFAKP
jgi:hypothetical protein